MYLYVLIGEMYVQVSAHFLSGLFVLMLLSVIKCKFWRLIPISHIICKYFLPFCELSFHLFMVSFAVQKLLSLIKSHLFILVFISITLGNESKKILLNRHVYFCLQTQVICGTALGV